MNGGPPQVTTDSHTAPPEPPGESPPAMGESRVFPCLGCGADLTFSIGDQQLKCPHCGHVKTIETDPEAAVTEQDFEATLKRLVELRAKGGEASAEFREVRCDACAATVRFTGTITSSACAYCGVPLQLANVHDATDRIPVDAVLPFAVDHEKAHDNLHAWVKSRWFAPNDFRRRGVDGKFSGVYLPFWTFDSFTSNRWSGMRGDAYYVTVGSGKNRRRVRRIRWTSVSGSFQRFFDDVLVIAGTGLPDSRIEALEPWPLEDCASFRAEMLAGFLARTYDVPLEEGFVRGKQIMDDELRADVCRRIGGDEQKITSLHTRHEAVTYKHLLLPVWMLAYRFRNKSFQVVVNAVTGEVQGDRPWSWIKITLAVLAGLIAAGGAVALFAALE